MNFVARVYPRSVTIPILPQPCSILKGGWLKEDEITRLRKQYPADKFDVKKSQGSLIVSPKKVVVRAFENQIKTLKKESVKDLTEKLEALMQQKKLSKEDFKQMQVSVHKEFGEKLKNAATACGTRKIIYLSKLLEGVPK